MNASIPADMTTSASAMKPGCIPLRKMSHAATDGNASSTWESPSYTTDARTSSVPGLRSHAFPSTKRNSATDANCRNRASHRVALMLTDAIRHDEITSGDQRNLARIARDRACRSWSERGRPDRFS